MRSSLICALTVSLVAVTPFSFANEQGNSAIAVDTKVTATTDTNEAAPKTASKVVSETSQSVIAANVLCQNIPVVDPKNIVQAQETYAKYIEQVAELFGSNAKDIKSNIVGINKDHQMSYELNSPINIVGISFNTVNILTLKGQNYNYYQITANKQITSNDEGLIKNIPQSDKLTISLENKNLSIMCNVRVPMAEK